MVDYYEPQYAEVFNIISFTRFYQTDRLKEEQTCLLSVLGNHRSVTDNSRSWNGHQTLLKECSAALYYLCDIKPYVLEQLFGEQIDEKHTSICGQCNVNSSGNAIVWSDAFTSSCRWWPCVWSSKLHPI